MRKCEFDSRQVHHTRLTALLLIGSGVKLAGGDLILSCQLLIIMSTKRVGNFGEKIASKYLKGKGYKILARNYVKNWSSLKKGEVDIICKKKDTIFFVEVKTISQPFGVERENLSSAVFSPEEKVNSQKQKKLINLAQSWLAENNISLESKWQIDVVSVKVDQKRKKAKVNHFQNVVSC